MEIGHFLKKARESKKMSQLEVAELLGISQKTLSNFESGKSQPTVVHLAQLHELYQIDILELLCGQGIFLGKNLHHNNPLDPMGRINFSTQSTEGN